MESKVWLKQYIPGVPDTINPDAFSSLVALFEKYVNDYAERPVFISFGVSITYRKIKTLVDDFASFLQNHCGLKKGDRFAIMMPNLFQYPVALFGALKAGLIVVNVNPLYTASETEKQLNDAGAKAIIVLENFADKLEKALPNTAVEHVVITKVGDLLGSVKGAVYNFAVRYLKGDVPDYDIAKAIAFKKALRIGAEKAFSPVKITNGDIAFLQYTGGTTGKSKGAILTHRNMVANVLQCVSWIRWMKADRQIILVGALPLYHIFSLTVCGICVFAMGAATLLIANPRDMSAFVKALRGVKVTMMIGLNTLFNALLHHPDFSKVDFSGMRVTMSGGMAMQRAVAEHWHKVTGVPVLEGYGLTETSPVVTMCPTTVSHFCGSAGVPIPSTQVEIRDEEGNVLACQKQGEIWVYGPQVMQGYWHQEAETNNVFDANGWLRTGDIGYLDERGYLYIVDRKKDMILVSGFNVYPNEVEDVLVSHPGVHTAAVIGIPSDKTGEALKAYIIKDDPAVTEEVLKAYCRDSLTAYKVPKLFEFRDELPLSNVGKVLRRELRDEAIKQAENLESASV